MELRVVFRNLVRFMAIGVLAIAPLAQAVLYDEVVSGDLSGDRLTPTFLTASLGSHEIVGSMNRQIDIEYFTFVVQPGQQLSSLVVAELQSADLRSFIGVQSGTQFTVSPSTVQPSDLLGYTHFGVAEGNIGTDILDNIGTGFGATGFTGTLQAGPYTFWLQDIDGAADYRLDFQVAAVPEPGEYAMMLAGVAVVAGIARRRRIPLGQQNLQVLI